MKQALIHYIQNGKNDELYTPEYAITPLLPYIPKNITVWECTDYGSSNITKLLKQHGCKVISTHKSSADVQSLNFLTNKPDFDFDMIITNPPYSLKDDFIERCYELGKPFALLLPLTALEGIKRGKLFKKYGLEMMVFDRRINFMNDKKSNWFNTSWFCHNVLPE